MKSRTSFFNPTVFQKNLTRFAPVWGLYTLCLVLGILLMYTNGGTLKEYHFASNLAELIQILAPINLIYGAIVAQVLFGDLYNSRMCYALHAMPMTRECRFVTNVCSGLIFSLVPTAVMTALALPLVADSCFVDAWQLPLLVFAAGNLQFTCFFGLAVFACLCVGSRLTMAVIYGLLNFGAQIAYWIIDNLYTPMLYGVITPTTLANNLTPAAFMTNYPFIEVDGYGMLRDKYTENVDLWMANFTLTENWGTLVLWAVAGLGFLALALILYRQRKLECAGDAVAFKFMEPVFQVLCAVLCAVGVQFFLYAFLGYGEWNYYLFLLAGLVVGWFGCRMLIERSTRVFRLRNWIGLGALTAALALSLVFTSLDVFGIDEWQPDLEDIQSVRLGSMYGENQQLTDEDDIRRVLALQKDALEDRLEYSGPYVQAENGEWVYNIDTNKDLIGREQEEITDCIYAFNTHIVYTLKNGKEIARRYTLWSDGQSGDTARDILSRWECVRSRYGYEETDRLEEILDTLEYMAVDSLVIPEDQLSRELAEGFLEAVKADCEAGTMAQDANLHHGHFFNPDADPEIMASHTRSLFVDMSGKMYGWYVDVYPDSENTVRWLREHNLLPYEIRENNLHYN